MAKKQPAWQIMGLPEQPPVDAHGYVNYGTVYSADQGSQRESLWHALSVAWWSYKHWGRKIRKALRTPRG